MSVISSLVNPYRKELPKLVRFQGRVVDPAALWGNYVNFPPNFDANNGDEFSPLVQCPNPEHQTEKRHFQVNLKKPLVHCFANCGISGTYEHAIAMVEGTTQREARRRILKHSRVGTTGQSSQPRRKHSVKPQTVLDVSYETYIPQAGIDYLSGRGFTSDSISRWELGWDSETLRVVIPAKDKRGRTKFLIRRAVREKDQPKYLYDSESEKNSLLFGACFIDPGMVRSEGIILVEGSLDTIMNHQNGLKTTGGILGNRLSKAQAQYIMNLRPKAVFTMFDPDGAGLDATLSVRQRISGCPVFVCRYPRAQGTEKLDPAKLNAEQAVRMIERAIPMARFVHQLNLDTRSLNRKRELKISG